MLQRFAKLLPQVTGQRSVQLIARSMSSLQAYNFETLKVTSPKEYVYNVELNRPKKANAMNKAFWREMVLCFNQIGSDPDCRVVLLTGSGKIFTSGLDLMDAADMFMNSENNEIGRKAMFLKRMVADYQETFTSIEKCQKPVIAAVHSACVGGGIDMITACDMRYCTSDAWFQVKEVDIGLAADVGTLQRLPKVIGNDSLARELCYSARKMYSDEAKECGLVSRVFPDKESMVESAIEMASLIASKSPIAVQGTKVNLVYSRDHSVAEGLAYMAAWNQAFLQSEDLMKAATAAMSKEKAVFSKL